jgi:hypothetical protein
VRDLHAHTTQVTERKFLVSRADRKSLRSARLRFNSIQTCATFPCGVSARAVCAGHSIARVNIEWGPAQKETPLVLDAPAELAVSCCRRLAALPSSLAFVHPRQPNTRASKPALLFYFYFFRGFCLAFTSLHFSESARKFGSQIPPLSSLFTDILHQTYFLEAIQLNVVLVVVTS